MSEEDWNTMMESLNDKINCMNGDTRYREEENLFDYDIHLGTPDELIRFLTEMEEQLHKHKSQKKSLRPATKYDTMSISLQEIRNRANMLTKLLENLDKKNPKAIERIDKQLIHIANYCMFAWVKSS